MLGHQPDDRETGAEGQEKKPENLECTHQLAVLLFGVINSVIAPDPASCSPARGRFEIAGRETRALWENRRSDRHAAIRARACGRGTGRRHDKPGTACGAEKAHSPLLRRNGRMELAGHRTHAASGPGAPSSPNLLLETRLRPMRAFHFAKLRPISAHAINDWIRPRLDGHGQVVCLC